ncbi:mutT/nudix family protein [Streptococcus pneumoniae]|nr:mutT/nudix family protein [Streptococcus pneumoniae]VKB13306.1 mutT/nudix family protein [Streptococcus pneumoniae]VNT11350.1 mutT/nudix family protein [Streptococcus pneumoniae]VPZ23938.1 mutT/nudix family protein [Streptococcus pneumoniae]
MQWQTQLSEKKANTDYIARYGVYAVIPNPEQKQIVLVQEPNGAWFLPCGEIEECELIEELGFTAEIGTYYGQADEYFYSRHRDTYYYNPAYLYEATSFKEVQKPLEDFNHITWFPIDEAIQNLKRGSHKWAIESWKK